MRVDLRSLVVCLVAGLLEGCLGCAPVPPTERLCSSNSQCNSNELCSSSSVCVLAPDMATPDMATLDMATPDMPSRSGEDLGDMTTPPTLNSDWARRFGSSSTDNPVSTAVGADGTVALLTADAAAFDLDGRQIPGGLNVTVLENNLGKLRWSKSIPIGVGLDDLSRYPIATTVDAAGDVLVALTYSAGGLDCGNGKSLSSAGAQDVFLFKYRGSDGTCLSSTVFGGGGSNESVYGLATNAAREIFVVGRYDGTASFYGATYPSNGEFDMYAARFDANLGSPRLVRWGSNGRDTLYSVAVDASGAVYVAGTFSAGLTVNLDGPLPITGARDALVMKLNRDLDTVAWVRTYGSPSNDVAFSVAVSTAGEVALAGAYSGTIDFDRAVPGRVTLGSQGGLDGFLLSVDSSGASRWAKSFGGGSDEWLTGVAIDGLGFVSATGSFSGQAKLDGADFTALASDAFLARYTLASGARSLLQIFSTTKSELLWGVAANPRGNTVIAGSTDADSITLAGKMYMGAGSTDVLVLELAPSFTPLM